MDDPLQQGTPTTTQSGEAHTTCRRKHKNKGIPEVETNWGMTPVAMQQGEEHTERAYEKMREKGLGCKATRNENPMRQNKNEGAQNNLAKGGGDAEGKPANSCEGTTREAKVANTKLKERKKQARNKPEEAGKANHGQWISTISAGGKSPKCSFLFPEQISHTRGTHS